VSADDGQDEAAEWRKRREEGEAIMEEGELKVSRLPAQEH